MSASHLHFDQAPITSGERLDSNLTDASIDYEDIPLDEDLYIKHLDKSFVQVASKVIVPERHVSVSKECLGLKSSPRSWGHGIVVADPVGATNGVGKLQSVVPREANEVLRLDVVALDVGGRRGRETTVARRSGAENTGVGICRVVDPDNDALPVVAVAAYDVTSGWLVLGPVPCVHDSELAPVPGCSSVSLALVLITASSADIASVLETSAANEIRERLNFWLHRFMCLPGVAIIVNRSVGLATMGNV